MTILVENPMVVGPYLPIAVLQILYNTIACAFIPFFGVPATILLSGIIDCKNATVVKHDGIN